MQGFLDQLEEQLEHCHAQYAHLVYSELVRARTPGTAHDLVVRRQELAMAICRAKLPVSRDQVRTLTPQLAASYLQSTEKTLARDLFALEQANLIQYGLGG